MISCPRYSELIDQSVKLCGWSRYVDSLILSNSQEELSAISQNGIYKIGSSRSLAYQTEHYMLKAIV